ncbi:hypothetical protein [Actinomadura harenae]|uniref:Uncharacterized protein n=1 Tax=Actinomadura harenae TaxID=2483351 RepID=A0A3M2MDL4_9ACTN|nr:hypothetical protein [Actinomadura harenae]RMI47611.1 hypothetical protein EBO15_01535 [Actinomadura harenae]
MAVTVPTTWTGSNSSQDVEIITNPTTGNWLIAVVACRVVDGSAPTLSIGDISRNLWTLLATDTAWATATNAPAQLQIEVWACPAVAYQGWPWLAVYAAASQITADDVGHVLLSLIEVNGLSGAPTVDSITTAAASASTTASITVPAPAGGAQCLMVVGAVTDNGTANPTPGAGTAFAGPNLTGSPAASSEGTWLTSTTAQTVSWTAASAVNWAIIGVALRVAGNTAPQPNANWPGVQLQVGIGYDLSTPLSRVRWTDQSSRLLSMQADRGIQAELGAAQQGTIDLEIRNQDGAYTPRLVTAAASATAAGTTTTIILPATTSPLTVGDFFRLQTSGGAWKELNVFQVTQLSTTGGTTTVTFVRADGSSGGARVATATGDVYAGIRVDLYLPVRVLATWQGKPYPVASGWLRDMPITYTDAAWATVQGQAGDTLETLTAAPPTVARGEILRRNPTHYWPLSDASGAGAAQNISGLTTSVLTQSVSKYGAGVATQADFGASSQGIDTSTTSVPYIVTFVGDSGSCWRQSGQTSAEMPSKGYALVGTDGAFPSLAGGVTIIGYTLTTGADLDAIINATSDPTVLMLRTADPSAGIAQGSVLRLFVQRGNLNGGVVVWDKSTHMSGTTTISGANQLFGGWTMWAITITQTAWTLYAAGQFAGGGVCNLVPNFTTIDIGGEADQFSSGRTYPGYHAHIAIFPRILTPGEIYALGSVVTGAPAIEDAGNRIQRKLNSTGWRGARILGTSVPIRLTAEADPSGTVADAASEYAGYADSLTFADAAGQFQYRGRNMAYQQSPRVTLGESTAGGEIPYKPGMQPSFNPTFIYNSVAVENSKTWTQIPTTTNSISAVDDTSATRYGTRSMSKQTRFASDQDAWHEAYWLMNRYAYPQMRVEQVTISASAYPAAWPTVLGIEVGDLVTLVRRQIGAPALTLRCRVLRVQPHLVYGAGGQVQGEVTLTLGAAPPIVGVAGDPAYGVVGNIVLGA